MSQHVLSTFTGEAAQAAVEAVVLFINGLLFNTSVNNQFLRVHLKH